MILRNFVTLFTSGEPIECYDCSYINNQISCRPDMHTASFDGNNITIKRVPYYCEGKCALSVTTAMGMYKLRKTYWYNY